ncbi:CopG family transcriptional regulator [Lamprobacter modestohalophilus]|jgi:metal-responsive CopG/Arc/MetJ family transcriptional regulator|uniref:CopG family transcriptional regulator n=1 Tax=Lamprobacter modestohalophilus TaxID=1064514 RepID=A0A9X1B4F0_9GAMM|nr:CopG family transcriptional regulator [Lamprobacter modestohalophilus]MBK1618676.1 CopG family transcriptional regulator [Lamprobacter modestohalophilus]MCF7980265.1 ribbon-helix-helix domain-containing protein [Chromatiaceae bacterium]MCF8005391.1 ribbon-helix-helix domain-containing protein [Chromatiaceae bacterium]MCF8014489.1 ribbon-helix-helix domain-containing protein [Chromatiaceae bacterium]
MRTEKLSISLTPDLIALIDAYRANHAIRSRSRVIEQALLRLREDELESAYRDAAADARLDSNIDADGTISDGLSHEAW